MATTTTPPLTTASVLTTTTTSYWSNVVANNNDFIGNVLLEQSTAYNYNRFHNNIFNYCDNDDDENNSIVNNNNNNNNLLSLDGHAYHCDGLIIAFHNDDQLQCRSTSGGDTFDCGTYMYQNTGLLFTNKYLSGTLFTSGSSFVASDMYYEDDLLLSFALEGLMGGGSLLDDNYKSSCYVVSLDYKNYNEYSYVGLQCPIQNLIPGVSYLDNHFSLGESGDVALRSPLSLSGGNNQIVRDSYGVFQWFANDDTIRMYFGPQQGRSATTLEGKLVSKKKQIVVRVPKKNNNKRNINNNNDNDEQQQEQEEFDEVIKTKEIIELYVNGYEPTGPCVYDGISHMKSLKGFTKQQEENSNNNKALFAFSTLTSNNKQQPGDNNNNHATVFVHAASSIMIPITTIVFISFITELLFRLI